MKRLSAVLSLLVAVSAATGCSSNANKNNTLTKAEAAEGWTLLFNGKDLVNWIPYGTELFYVDDESNLVVESGPDKKYGYLATEAIYKDFDCTFEFNEQANGNSGFFFHMMPESKEVCWQVEIAPKGLWSGGIYESYGRGWISRPAEEHLRDGWNKMRVNVVGNNVTVWLNDVEVTNLTDDAFAQSQGRIVLQIHDGGGIKVLFRNMKLMPL